MNEDAVLRNDDYMKINDFLKSSNDSDFEVWLSEN